MAAMRAVDPRVSYAELARWPDDGRRYELYDGEAIVVPAPNWVHQRIAFNVAKILNAYERVSGGGVVIAPFDIVLSDYDVLQPDVVYFGPEKRALQHPLEAAYVVPDLAVEVLSRSTERRDRGRKMELLTRYGLPEYWLIDPVSRSLEIYVKRGDALILAGAFDAEQPICSPTLPDLAVDFPRLFED
jgi:Uma2 family endonuclease